MADNEERKTAEENDDDYWCPDAPNFRCIKGHREGWRKSKECRYCRGRDDMPWPPED